MGTNHTKREKSRAELIRRAQALPGVQEVMAVYGYWRTLEDAARTYSQSESPRVITTFTSAPHYSNQE